MLEFREMITSETAVIDLQANEHPLIDFDRFDNIQSYILHLIHTRAYEEVVRLCRGKAVLDLGCNNGYGTDLLAKVAKSVIGADVSESALQDASRRFPGLHFRLVDGRSLPFEPCSFDVVVSFQVIEHVFNVPEYLKEIRRVLRPQGIALFTTPNAAIRLDIGMTPWNKFHVREFRAEDLRKILSDSFADVRIKGLFAVGHV